jgi:hypothetical protein
MDYRLNFCSNRSGADELSVISTEGTGERHLTTPPEDKSALAWTADCKEILFAAFARDTSHLQSGRNKAAAKLVGCPARSLS